MLCALAVIMTQVQASSLDLSSASPTAETSVQHQAAIGLLLAREHYSQAIRLVQTQPDYASNPQLQLQHAKALIGLQRHTEAISLLESAIHRLGPTADLYQALALSQFAMAEQAGLFKVRSYIKAGLASLQQAAQLSTEPATVKLKLLGFFLEAPAMLGGDQATAKQIASELQQAAPAEAAIARSMLHQQDEQFSQALAELDSQLQQTPNQLSLLVQKAKLLRSQQQDAAALPVYLKAAQLAEDAGARHQYLYQVGRSAAALTLEKDPAAYAEQRTTGIGALQQVIEFYQQGEGWSLHWARLKLAQLYLAIPDPDAAAMELQPVLALSAPPEQLAKELKTLQTRLKKQQRNQQESRG